MVRVTVRYDGKVLIPEDSIDLPRGVPLRVTVHTADDEVAEDAILGLDGLGAEVWQGVDPVDYQRQERRGWE